MLRHFGREAKNSSESRSKLITLELAKGFGLFMAKGVLSGRGDPIFDILVV